MGLQYKRVLADIDERMIKATALVAEWRAKILQAQPSHTRRTVPSCTVACVRSLGGMPSAPQCTTLL